MRVSAIEAATTENTTVAAPLCGLCLFAFTPEHAVQGYRITAERGESAGRKWRFALCVSEPERKGKPFGCCRSSLSRGNRGGQVYKEKRFHGTRDRGRHSAWQSQPAQPGCLVRADSLCSNI